MALITVRCVADEELLRRFDRIQGELQMVGSILERIATVLEATVEEPRIPTSAKLSHGTPEEE
jgi:hypothetical protein